METVGERQVGKCNTAPFHSANSFFVCGKMWQVKISTFSFDLLNRTVIYIF